MHHILFFGGVFVLVSKAPYIAYLPIYQLLFTEIFKGKINWKKKKSQAKSQEKLLLLIIYRSDMLPAH